MKMELFRTALLLLASVVAVAQQDTSSQQPSTTPSGQQSTTDVGGHADDNEPLFRGCLSGSDGNYMLKAENGRTYRLHSDKDLNEHVGNMVEIRGTIKNEDGDRSERKETADGTKIDQEIDVADVKTAANGCDSQAR